VEHASFAAGRLRGPDGEDFAWPELAVLGDPVEHSASPVLHGAALKARGIEAHYRAIRVALPDLAEALSSAADAGVRGLNLTLPLKSAGLASVGRRTEECRRIGAANTLVQRGGIWTAHNTDSRGMAMALERSLGSGLSGQIRDCVILGAGGAARAAAAAFIAARIAERARWAEEFGAGVSTLEDAAIERATFVVNCTPLGLDPEGAAPVDPRRIRADAYVLDMTYSARPSRLLAESRAPGEDGRAMLVAQAALAFSIWYGALPPVREMAAVLEIDW
jgi:shikimate dehydrogenase